MSSHDDSVTEFLDDYFLESEEHLGSIRRHLLVMETFGSQDRIDPGVVDQLLGALHSLKGLSAMVGVHDAEQVAHAMEDSLRRVKLTGTGPTDGTMEALANGTSAIEQAIAARRQQNPGPHINAVLSRLAPDVTKPEQLLRFPAEAAQAPEIAPAMPLSSVVRVDMKRLDDLMSMVSDLVISRSHVETSLRRLEAIVPVSAWRELQDANLLMQRQLRDLREGIMRVRMVPIGQIFERIPFVVRSLARESHKVVCLELTGHDIEIDKLLVEKMMDPLLHMVRNAISHGLEPPEDRVALGKTSEGHLRLHASTDAETVIIELEDDGRGVDIEQVASRSRILGLIGPDETSVKTLDSSRVLQMICAPGFSTREEADIGAGHGLGMAIVKRTISGLGGTLAMDTLPGKGTRFTIRVPLTLAIVQAFIAYVDGQPFAVPRFAIHEVLRVETHAVTTLQNNEVIPYRGGVLPIVYLNRFFRMNEKPAQSFHVLVAGCDSSPVGIAADRIAGQREIVVRSIDDYLVRVPGIAGVTELGDGRPVLILDLAAIVKAACTDPALKL